MISKAVKPRTTRVLPRGNWMDESGPIVLPAVPEFLGTNQIQKGKAYQIGFGQLADGFQNGKGKLHARVLANRDLVPSLWKGSGTRPTDFGGQGTPPEHPELLDNLAHLTAGKEMESKAFIQGHHAKPDLPTIHTSRGRISVHADCPSSACRICS